MKILADENFLDTRIALIGAKRHRPAKCLDGYKPIPKRYVRLFSLDGCYVFFRCASLFFFCVTLCLTCRKPPPPDPYASYKKDLQALISAREECIKSCQAAKTAKPFAGALTAYNEKIRPLIPALRSFEKAHPEIRGSENKPEAVTRLRARQKELALLFEETVHARVASFANSASVRKAWIAYFSIIKPAEEEKEKEKSPARP